MLAQPDHDRLDRHADWQVQSVFDPDGGGKDFGYTIGLHDRGLPELHIWGRPDRGDDPGDDWMLSPCDRVRVLNEFAWGLIDGTLAAGSEVRREYDDGLAVVHYRVQPPGDRDLLEAFGIAPGATVLPVSWSLTRPPEGPLTELDEATRARFRREYDELVADLQERRWAPEEWLPPLEPSFDPSQRFGPLTPMVLARAAQLWHADDTALDDLIGAAQTVETTSSLTYPCVVAASLARSVGRRPAVEQVRQASVALVEHVMQTSHMHESWRGMLLDIVQPVLTAEALADRLDESWLLQTRGFWLAGLGDLHGEVPGPAWVAEPHVLDTVRSLLSTLTFVELGTLKDRHAQMWDGGRPPLARYGQVFARLRGMSFLGGAACAWAGCLSELPAWRALTTPLSAAHGRPVAMPPVSGLQEWASGLTAAITHRAKLSADDVSVFSDLCHDLLPDLEEVLNDPLTKYRSVV